MIEKKRARFDAFIRLRHQGSYGTKRNPGPLSDPTGVSLLDLPSEGTMTTKPCACADVAILDVCLQQLGAMLRQPAVWSDQGVATAFDHLSELVAALPLTTEEHCFAANWI